MKNIEFAPGALKPNILPLSYEFGGMTPVRETLLFPNGITEFLPPKRQQQVGIYGDTWGCVSHSFKRAVEILIHRNLSLMSGPNRAWAMKELYVDDFPYLSDRDLVVLSGTKPGVGNSGEKVLDTARVRGMVAERFAPWDMVNRDPKENTIEKYYLYGRTPEAQAFADEFNQRLELVGEWVSQAKWKEASKYGVLQLYVNAWFADKGVYYNPTSHINHAVLMENYDNKTIFDTYIPWTKTMRSWDDTYIIALKINIIEKHMEKLNIPNNTLVVLVEGLGSIGLFLDGKIIIDEPAKINSVFMARNSKNNFFSGGPTMSLTQAQWNSFEHINLKGELIK